MKTSRQLLTLIWAALATATAAFAQNITVQKTPHTASPADELTLSSRIMVVPTGGSITATGSGVIQATEVGPSFGVPYTQVTLVPTLRLLGRTTTGTGAAEALTAGSSLTLAAGSLNAVQDIRTTAAPTFAGATFSGLTADALVYGNGSKALASAAVGTSLTFGTGTLNTIQGIRTTDSPTFAALTLTAPLTGANGGTGVANSGKTVTLGGNLATSGAFGLTLTLGATTNVTLPSTGTLATLAGAEAFTNKTYNGMTLTATTGTFTLANGKTLSVAKSLTFDGTDGTTQTFPTTSASIARTDAGQTFTGTQAFGALTATTLNGNAFTTGTGTLTIAAGKVLTQSNTLTFTGTDSSTVNFGAGGTVLYSGGAGFVSSIAGTANQVSASAATGAVTLSIPSTFVAPGTIAATSTSVANSGADASILTPGGLGVAKNAVIGTATTLTGSFTEGLTVASTVSTLPRGISNIQVSADTASANISGYKARGTVGAEAAVASADVMLNLRGWGWSGSTTKYVNSTSIRSVVNGTVADNRVPSQMDFYTSTDASTSVLTLAMSISNAQLLTLTPGGTAQGINAVTINNPNDAANKSYALGTGSWFTSGVPYFRATKASSPGILDVLANGAAQDSWIDIGSDYTVDFTNGEFLELRKTASGYASIKAKGIGTGVARPLVFEADGSYVSVGSTSAQTVGAGGLYVSGSTASTTSSTGALQVVGGVGIGGAVNIGTTATVGTNLTVTSSTFLTGGTAWLGADTSALIAGNGIKIAPISNAATTERQSIQIDTYNASGASDGFLLFRRARGSEASPTAVQSGDLIYSITARGYGATAFGSTPRTRFETTAAENWTDSAQGAYITVQTTPTGGTATTEVMRITPNGNLLVGSTTDVTGAGTIVASAALSAPTIQTLSGSLSINDLSGQSVLFKLAGTEKARMNGNGNFLFGTTGDNSGVSGGAIISNSTIFEGIDAGGNVVAGDGFKGSSNTRSMLQLDTYSSSAGSGALMIFRHARGTFASPSQTLADDTLYSTAVRGYNNSSAFTGTAGKFEFFAAEAYTSSAIGTYATLSTTPTGSTTNAEVTRWTAAGNLLVGTTAETGLTGAGGVRIGSTTTSTTTGTGALVVLGGAGIAGPEFVGGVLNAAGVATMANTTEATNSTTAGTVVSGGLGVAKKIWTASSITTGAPTAGSAGAWKLGANQTGVALTVSTTNGVRVNVDGTDYTLAVLTTNP